MHMTAKKLQGIQRRTVYLVSVAVFLLLILLSFCNSVYHARLRVAYFSTTLAPFNDETVSVGIHTFVVRHGVVYDGERAVDGIRAAPALRLAYEKIVARNSPLVALPAVDLTQMEQSIEFLSRTEDILARHQKDLIDSSLVKTGLYPIEFLRTASALERARRTFLESGSESDSAAYRNAQKRTFVTYESNLLSSRNAFLLAVPEDMPPYVTKSVIVSRPSFVTALDTMNTGMLITREIFEQRMQCFSGQISECNSSNLLTPVIDPPSAPQIPSSVAARAKEIVDLFDESDMQLEKNNPIVLSGSECMGDDVSPALFSFMSAPGQELNARTILMPIYLNDITLLRSETFANLPFFEYFKEHDVTYVRSMHFSYYNCPHINKDVSRVYWIRLVRILASDTPISTYATGSAKEQLRALESRLLLSNATKEADAAEYVRLAQNFAENTNVPIDILHRLTELSLSYNNHSAGLEQSLFVIANTGVMNTNISEIGGGSELSLPFLFYVRSGFPLLFLADNPSVSGNGGRLFEKNMLPQNEQPGILYSQLPHTSNIHSILVHDFNFYLRLHRDAAASETSH